MMSSQPPTSPSPLGQSSTPGGSLHFRRPAPRGRPSLSSLRQRSSKASMRSTHILDDAGDDDDGSDAGEDTTMDASLPRSTSPTPASGMQNRAAQLGAMQAPIALPPRVAIQEPVTLDGTVTTLNKLMDCAHSGSFAVGALGQTLLDQQRQLRSMLDRLEEGHVENSGAKDLVAETQLEIEKMKTEQQRLVHDLLKASNIEVTPAHDLSSLSRAEAHAFIDTLGVQIVGPVVGDSTFTSPTKPASQNAREMRRQKNATAPQMNKDETLVNEIQQQLINEVRRLQALIAERDKALVNMTDTLEEAVRMKAIHEASIKRLESEKDAQDANLYEIERKEELLREENEEMLRQLKKHENELRTLKRQLAEKADVAEAFKVNNDELEQRMEDLRGSVATLKAKGIADQKTITGLKVQVNDWEAKHRQAVDKLPASASIASRLSSTTGDGTGDSTQLENHSGRGGASGIADSPSTRRFGGAHDKALTPTASVDDELAARLRPNEMIKNMEADIAKWRNAALKYRKKWSDTRRQNPNAKEERSNEDYDDSTDEEDDAVWLDEMTKRDPKRNSYIRARIVSSTSRRGGKTMGDAFGFGHRIVSSGSISHDKRRSWQSSDALDLAERSYNDGDEDDGDSSYAGSSVRGSIDGFDPNFGDPTLRGSKAHKGRSTYTPSNVAKASPLTRQLALADDADSEANDSFASQEGRRRPDSMIDTPVGVLGDELIAVKDSNVTPLPTAESFYSDAAMITETEAVPVGISEADHLAAIDRAVAERNSTHAKHIDIVQKQHADDLTERDVQNERKLQIVRQQHDDLLKQRDAMHSEQIDAIQKENRTALTEQGRTHSRATELALQRHAQALSKRETEHESQLSELEQRHEDKIKSLIARHSKIHDEAMADARERHSEILAKHRDEAQTTLLAAEREHKALLDERDRLHSEALKHAEAQRERELMRRDKEHQDMLEDVQATHESFINQRDSVFTQHIAQREQMIKDKDEELSALHNLVLTLEGELKGLRARVQEAEARLASSSRELEELSQASATAKALAEKAEAEKDEAVASAAVATAALAASHSSQHSHDSFEDARDEQQLETAVKATEIAAPTPVVMQENSSQTDETADRQMRVSEPSGQQTDTESLNVASSTADRPDTNTDSRPAPSTSSTTITPLPPLPSMPPPPTLSSLLARSKSARDAAPGRPTSPPPSDLLARSQVDGPLGRLQVPNTSSDAAGARPSGRLTSGPPPSSYMQQANQRRSATPTTRHDGGHRAEADRASIASRTRKHPMRAPSAQSFASDATSDMMSGRTSRTSNYFVDDDRRNPSGAMAGRESALGGAAHLSTDPVVLGAITQTMIGEYLYKYTRRSMGRSNTRHQRYFWVHPYTRTLYWTVQSPSEAVSTEVVNKSAFIQDVMVVEDTNATPPDLYHLSIVVSTLARDVKMTALNQEQHNRWVTALGYLVNREMPTETRPVPSEWRQSISRASLPRQARNRPPAASFFAPSGNMTPTAGTATSRRQSVIAPHMSPSKSSNTIVRRPSSALDTDRTPRARGASVGMPSSSLLHRKDTAAKEYLEQYEALRANASSRASDLVSRDSHEAERSTSRAGATSSMSRRSGRGSLAREMFGGVGVGRSGEAGSADSRDPRQHMTAEQMLAEDEERAGINYDGLTNVRACCDGKHDVGSLAHHGKSSRQRQNPSSVRARISTPSLLHRSSRASKVAEPSSSAAPPQLGPLNINSLDSALVRSNADPSTIADGDRTVTVAGDVPGTKSAASTSDFHTANEFGGLSGRATPSSDTGNGISNAKHRGSIASASHVSSYIDRITQIRRNRASTSIR